MSTDCNVIYCDHCGKMSREFNILSYHDICYEEHELQPGPSEPRNWRAEEGFFVQLAGNGFGCDYPTHEHWCVQCWNKLTLPHKPKLKRYRVATAWDRLQAEDSLALEVGFVEVHEDDPAVAWRQQPDWNFKAHMEWEDRQGS